MSEETKAKEILTAGQVLLGMLEEKNILSRDLATSSGVPVEVIEGIIEDESDKYQMHHLVDVFEVLGFHVDIHFRKIDPALESCASCDKKGICDFSVSVKDYCIEYEKEGSK